MQVQTRAPLTYADFVRFPDDGRRHELIGGVHYVTPSPATRHQRLVVRLIGAFYDYFGDHPVGEVFTAPFDTVLSEHDVVEPDLLVILDDQADIVSEAHVRGAPGIVIEILSPTTRRRDEGVKRRLYERAGVREYWLVDPAAEIVTVHRRGDQATFETAVTFAADAGALLQTALLPGFALDVRTLFSRPAKRR